MIIQHSKLNDQFSRGQKMRSGHRRSGVVLIVTLWLVMTLATVALTFGHSIVFRNRISANITNSRQSEHAIDAALRYAIAVLNANNAFGELPDAKDYSSEFTIGKSRVYLMAQSDDAASAPALGFKDEASKLNLNTATKAMLEALPGVTSEIAAAIIDWRDEDNVPTAGGAENETYSRKEPAYQTKNGPFETVEELILVHGVTRQLLIGKDRNRNGVIEASESARAEQVQTKRFETTSDFGLIQFLTVLSDESNKDPDNQDRVNINDRNTSKLRNILTEKLDSGKANSVVQKTKAGRTTYTSLASFYKASGLEMEEFARVDDYLSTRAANKKGTGLVNVNTASSTVLACIPGIDSNEAAELVRYRSSNPDTLHSQGWISVVLNDESLKEAGPYLTSRTNRYAVDIAATSLRGRGYKRIYHVIDTSGDEPHIIYRRDLSAYGWSMAADSRQKLAQGDTK